MAGSMPDLRGQIAALVDGSIPLDRLLDWYWANADAIEFGGSDEDVELLNLVAGLLDEYTGDHIDAADVVDAMRTDPLVQQELHLHRTAVS